MEFFKAKLFFVFVFLISALITLLTLTYFNSQQLSNFLNTQTHEAEHRYNGMVLFPNDTSDIIFTTLINTPKVINIFKHAATDDELRKDLIREELLKFLQGSYNRLKAYNIQQLHFHLPNNDSFLRFHRPGKYGDNLTDVRKTVAYVNEYQIPVQGFEEGKIFNGYRFVYPLFDENHKHLGSVEISHSINIMVTIYQRIFESSNLNIVLQKDVVSEKLFSDELKNYETYPLNEKYVLQKSVEVPHHITEIIESIEDIEKVKKKMDNFENFSISVKHEEHYDLVSFVVIKNPITLQPTAYAVSYRKSEWLSYFYSEYKRQFIFNIFISLLFTFGVYFALKYYNALKDRAYQDGLTKIYNRYFFEKYLYQKYHSLERGSKLSVIMLDVDFFKKINDTHGHKVGDESLKYLVRIINENIRKSDVFARWGGEEFMILVEEDLDGAVKVAENLREKIDELTDNEPNVVHFTCSFGIIALDKNISLDESYTIVDDRLYKAKEMGRNRVVFS